VKQIKLNSGQLTSVQEYCKLNNIENVDKFISKCFVDGFNISKYGLLGDDSEKIGGIEEKPVEIEVIKEIQVEVVKYVEVPVEIIKEVEVVQYVEKEVIKEVPVEIIKEKIVNVIQEVPVEKIVYIYDKKEDESVTNLDNICDKPEPVIVEKIVEVIKEVPVEKIVEIEKIVEVEKSNDKMKLIQETLQKLRKELSDKNSRIEELEKINKNLESIKVSQGAVFLKGSNINETL
jgi:hypothetical protein